MTASTFNKTEIVQDLSDQELAQVSGGFFRFLLKKVIKHIFTAGTGLWMVHDMSETLNKGK